MSKEIRERNQQLLMEAMKIFANMAEAHMEQDKKAAELVDLNDYEALTVELSSSSGYPLIFDKKSKVVNLKEYVGKTLYVRK